MKVFYSPRMVAQDGGFSPSPRKPALVVDAWREAGVPLDLAVPEPVTVDDFSLAHERQHVEDILAGRKKNGFGNTDPEVAHSLGYTTGSMLSGARWAIAHRTAVAAPCSGFHHAGWRHAAAFCTFNGLMVTALKLHSEGVVKKVAILDCDYHYGDGTNDIIARLGVGDWIRHVTAEEGYVRNVSLLETLPSIIETFSDCDLVLYQAGADAHIDDPLGGFLNTQQLLLRDRIVFRECQRRDLPIVWNLAGGYQNDFAKILEIHVNTARACEAQYTEFPV